MTRVQFPPGALTYSHNRGIVICNNSGELAANTLDGDALDESREDLMEGLCFSTFDEALDLFRLEGFGEGSSRGWLAEELGELGTGGGVAGFKFGEGGEEGG